MEIHLLSTFEMAGMNAQELRQLATAAYGAELGGQIDEALRLHEAVVSALSKDVKHLSSLSTDEREQKRVANKRNELHSERIEVLKELKKNASTPYLVPPSAASTSQQLAAGSSLSIVSDQDPSGNHDMFFVTMSISYTEEKR